MSRLLECLYECSELSSGPGPEDTNRHLVLDFDNLLKLAKLLSEKLQAENTYINVSLPLLLPREAPNSKRVGMVEYELRMTLCYSAPTNAVEFVVGVGVNGTTLCPCSKAIAKYGAHNQRSKVTYDVAHFVTGPDWEDSDATATWDMMHPEAMIENVESCFSSKLYAVLKRPDEKVVTEAAYENPSFVEDMVRKVYQQHRDTVATFEDLPESVDVIVVWYRITSTNFESIHMHNAVARVERGARQLCTDQWVSR